MNQYVKYLSDKTKNEKFVDRLKIVLRPLIFPMDLLLAQIKKEDSIFDIGCGSGQFLLVVAEFVKAKSYVGIEISEKLVSNANNLFSKFQQESNYNFQQYDGENFPKEIESSDKIFMNDVLHHIPKDKQEAFLRNIYNSMSSKSRFILKDIDAASPLVVFNKIHDLVFSGEIGNEISFKKAKYLLEQNGFEITLEAKKRIWWYPHYILVCKKR